MSSAAVSKNTLDISALSSLYFFFFNQTQVHVMLAMT